MFVGEQPGDQEDRQGAPFVGPAGAMLDKALEDAGIPRRDVYVTNAVKHFKWEPRGKRRIHKKPRISEIKACRPWLEAELRAVKPQVVVLLGATAAQSIMGSQFKLTQHRGKLLQTPGPVGPGLPIERVVATIHPSAVLRAPDSEGRRAAYESLVADLKVVARALRSGRRFAFSFRASGARGVCKPSGPPPRSLASDSTPRGIDPRRSEWPQSFR